VVFHKKIIRTAVERGRKTEGGDDCGKKISEEGENSEGRKNKVDVKS